MGTRSDNTARWNNLNAIMQSYYADKEGDLESAFQRNMILFSVYCLIMCAAWFAVFWYNYQLYELVLKVEQRATLPANWLTRMPFENAPPRFNQKMAFKNEPKNPIPIYRRSELIKEAMRPTFMEMLAVGVGKSMIRSQSGR
jgi:hypothetical protein